MAIMDVIKYEGDSSVLIYKYPVEDFNTLSKLIVHESQQAVFFSDGQALDTFSAGRHTLETKNIPLISKIRNLVTGGVSSFHCEVYFINLAASMNMTWGTPTQATVQDPNYLYSYNVGANGSMGIRVSDGRNLLLSLVGTDDVLTTAQIQKYFKDMIVTRVTSQIAVELSKHSYNQINAQLNNISSELQNQLREEFLEYGIEIFNFKVAGIAIDSTDLSELKKLDNSRASKKFEAMGNAEAGVIESQGRAQQRQIEGFSWEQEQQFDVAKTFAGNEGFSANPANMVAQIPMAFTMGNMLNSSIVNGFPDNQNQKVKSVDEKNLTCSECNETIPKGSKFCPYCGKPVIQKQKYCLNCGSPVHKGAKFCSECGGQIL